MTATATATKTRTIGAMVRYHGSITSEHWAPFYISAIDETGRLTLIDRDYPQVTTLRGVRPGSVTPTGEILNLCECGHEVAFNGSTYSSNCGVCGLTCTHDHGKES